MININDLLVKVELLPNPLSNMTMLEYLENLLLRNNSQLKIWYKFFANRY